MAANGLQAIRLAELAGAIHVGGVEVEGDGGVRVSGVAYDSRRVRKGDLFVALGGRHADGAAYVGEAVGRGAVAVLHAGRLALPGGVGGIRCGGDVRRAMGEVAAVVYGDPTRGLRVVGVTGTNGKTTTAFMIRDLLEGGGLSTVLLGTVVYTFGGREIPAVRTMPETPDTQGMFAEAVRAGCVAGVMEVSSQGVAAERHCGIHFAVGVFTNLTREHLDFHGGMEEYFEAKRRFFREGLGAGAPVVIGVDDGYGRRLAEEFCGEGLWTFSLEGEARIRARGIRMDERGSRFWVEMDGEGVGEGWIPFPGRHNIMNALGALGAGAAMGLSRSGMVAGLRDLGGVPGRLERVADERGGRHIFVDYAHTEDALRRVLETVREVGCGRVVCVVGCGGERDRSKRGRMGGVATALSDWAILTSDNPRGERAEAILEEMEAGVVAGGGYEVVVDRREAIGRALAWARGGDMVVIAGKGHEGYQEICGVRRPFDDRRVVREWLAAHG